MDNPNTRAWKGSALTNVGRIRSTNQDAFAVQERLGLWIVADGMGGRAGGNVASRLAVEAVIAHFKTAFNQTGPERPASTASLLREAIVACDRSIRSEAIAHPELNGMGTTIVVLHLNPGPNPEITLAHVGDSRAYLLRAERLTRLTRDHSLIEDYLSRRMISQEEALTHPQRHVLTRALGIEGQAIPDLSTHRLEPDDMILLCTDGLTKMLDDTEILDFMICSNGLPEAACSKLVEAANERGGKDNITVVVVCPCLDP